MADRFLERWSRRKQDARAGRPLAEPPQPPPADPAPVAAQTDTAQAQQAAAPAVPAPTLADAQALDPGCDFKPFVARGVAPEVRNLAMKKLFADPHFNLMDGLDIYIDDYSRPDPLPAGLLRKMVSAQTLGFFTPPPDAPNALEAADSAIAPAPERAGDGPTPGPAPDMAQSQPCQAIPEHSEPDPSVAATAMEKPASHTDHEHPDLRLQPDHSP